MYNKGERECVGSWVAAHVKREFEEASDRVEMEMYANRCI
jgi:hypothetical protein